MAFNPADADMHKHLEGASYPASGVALSSAAQSNDVPDALVEELRNLSTARSTQAQEWQGSDTRPGRTRRIAANRASSASPTLFWAGGASRSGLSVENPTPPLARLCTLLGPSCSGPGLYELPTNPYAPEGAKHSFHAPGWIRVSCAWDKQGGVV